MKKSNISLIVKVALTWLLVIISASAFKAQNNQIDLSNDQVVFPSVTKELQFFHGSPFFVEPSMLNENKREVNVFLTDLSFQSDSEIHNDKSQIVLIPDEGPKCALYDFEIHGQNTTFLEADVNSVYLIGQNTDEEYELYNLQVVSDTIITIHDVLPCDMTNGYYTLKIFTINQGVLAVPNAFLTNSNPLQHSAFNTPTSGSAGQTVYVNVYGTNTWFQHARWTMSGMYSPTTGFSFGCSDYNIISDDHAIVKFNIPGNTPPWHYNMDFINDIDGWFSFNFYISGPVGMDEADKKEPNIKIYPNPTSGMIAIDGSSGLAKISVFNTFGVEVYRGEQALPGQVNFAEYPKGVYVIQIETETNIFSDKITVN